MRLSLIILILFVQSGISAQNITTTKIDSIIQQRMKEYRIQGLSVGIVKEGKIFYTKGYGFTNTDQQYVVDADTRFVTGSITKLFTVTAVMQLVEQGKLDLNKKLIEYIPDFTLKDKRYKDITIFELVTHSSGLTWDNEMPATDSPSLRGFIYSLKDAKLNFAPGEKFGGETYSNTGYDILGYLVEKISGISFDQYIQQQILAKTAMNNSGFSYREIPANKLAMPLKLEGNSKEISRFNLYGEIKDQNPVLKYPEINIVTWSGNEKDNPMHHPSAWLYSTAADLASWMQYNLDVYNKAFNSFSFLRNSTLKQMWSLQKGIENKKTSIGLGWWQYADDEKGNYVFHVGRIPGYCSTLMIFPEKNIGITILCNGMYADDVVWNKLPFEILKVINQ